MLTASQPVAMSESGSFFDSASGVDISGSELNSIGGNQYKNSTVVHGTNIYVQAEARQGAHPCWVLLQELALNKLKRRGPLKTLRIYT